MHCHIPTYMRLLISSRAADPASFASCWTLPSNVLSGHCCQIMGLTHSLTNCFVVKLTSLFPVSVQPWTKLRSPACSIDYGKLHRSHQNIITCTGRGNLANLWVLVDDLRVVLRLAVSAALAKASPWISSNRWTALQQGGWCSYDGATDLWSMYLSHSVYLLTMSCMKCLLTNSKMISVTVDVGYFLFILATLN